MKNRSLHTAVSALILAVLTFHFLHSELDLITSQCEANHAAHDFCHLVDNTTTSNEHSGSQTLKKFISHVSFDVVLNFVLLPVNPAAPLCSITEGPERSTDKPRYILNRILLI